jgi:hypothetical protein
MVASAGASPASGRCDPSAGRCDLSSLDGAILISARAMAATRAERRIIRDELSRSTNESPRPTKRVDASNHSMRTSNRLAEATNQKLVTGKSNAFAVNRASCVAVPVVSAS